MGSGIKPRHKSRHAVWDATMIDEAFLHTEEAYPHLTGSFALP